MTAWTISANGPDPYTAVVKALVEMAETTDEIFQFGPFDPATLTTSGLTVVSDSDATVTALQAKVPGLSVERQE